MRHCQQLPLDLGISTRHVVMMSGGEGGRATAERVIERYGAEHLTLLFTDVLMEDSDLYRFLVEAACQLVGTVPPPAWLAQVRTLAQWHEDRFGRRIMLDDLRAQAATFAPHLIWIAEGRDPWEIFFAERMLGNSGKDPCSKKLKRELADRWLAANCHPDDTVVYLGIDWSEKHRFDDGEGHGAKFRYARNGWRAEAPLCEPPYVDLDKIARIKAAGLEPSRSYKLGYAHDNCAGFCVKAGQGHYRHRLLVDPDRYVADEAMEQGFIAFIDRPVSILSDRRGGVTRPLTLKELRERIQRDEPVERYQVGGCGCFLDEEAAA